MQPSGTVDCQFCAQHVTNSIDKGDVDVLFMRRVCRNAPPFV